MRLVKLKSLNHLFNIFEGGTQMEFRQLITFKCIVEHGGLEEEPHHSCCNPFGNHVTSPDYGERLVPYGRQILQNYYQIEDLDDAPKGRLTIGISESLMICRIPEVLEMYKKNYPKVQMALK